MIEVNSGLLETVGQTVEQKNAEVDLSPFDFAHDDLLSCAVIIAEAILARQVLHEADAVVLEDDLAFFLGGV